MQKSHNFSHINIMVHNSFLHFTLETKQWNVILQLYLKRIIGNIVIYKKLYINLIQRKIVFKSFIIDSDDLIFLIHNHFLVGDSLYTSFDLSPLTRNKLNRFQIIKKNIQHF